MFTNDNQSQLRDKLTILYVLQSFGRPMSHTQLSEFLLEQDMMNYFAMQQYIGEMNTSGLLEETRLEIGTGLQITHKGQQSLEIFKDRLLPSVKEDILKSISVIRDRVERERQIQARYEKAAPGQYMVHLQVLEGDDPLIDLKLTVYSSTRAKQLCERWKEDATSVYSQIMGLLITNE